MKRIIEPEKDIILVTSAKEGYIYAIWDKEEHELGIVATIDDGEFHICTLKAGWSLANGNFDEIASGSLQQVLERALGLGYEVLSFSSPEEFGNWLHSTFLRARIDAGPSKKVELRPSEHWKYPLLRSRKTSHIVTAVHLYPNMAHVLSACGQHSWFKVGDSKDWKVDRPDGWSIATTPGNTQRCGNCNFNFEGIKWDARDILSKLHISFHTKEIL